RDRRSPRASLWSRRAARGAIRRGRATPRRSCGFLARDPPEDPVHEPAGVLGRITLRQRDRLADRHLDGDRTVRELVDANPEHVPLDDSHPVGRPVLRRLVDARVERLRLLAHALRELLRERIDLAVVQRCERASGQIPLIEEEERCPAGRAPAAAHARTSSTETSTASTRTPHIVSSAPATLSWTARASSGRTAFRRAA